MTPRPFGSLPTGESVEAHTLGNAAGASVEILTYGGIVRSLKVPDRAGVLADVVLGFDTLGAYLAGYRPYFGAIIGRIAGRVRGGLLLNGRAYTLARTEGINHLHGGRRGFDKRIWAAQPLRGSDGSDSLRLSYFSPDGEEGYPGNLRVHVTYSLTATGALVFESEATSDCLTPLSMAQHSYFNLAGEASGAVLNHDVQIFANEYVPTDDSMTLSDIRTSVSGRSCDLRKSKPLKETLPGLFKSHGDMYLLRAPDAPAPAKPTHAARASERSSGRVLDVFTDETGLQFYTGVGLDGTLKGKGAVSYQANAGLCFECQGYPNASRIGGFGDILVQPGIPQRRRTIYAFSNA
jgi:aldose 1-epimerase